MINKKLMGGVVYLFFSIFFVILNFSVGYVTLYQKEGLMTYFLWQLVFVIIYKLPLIILDSFNTPIYSIFMVISRIALIWLGIILSLETNEKIKSRYLFRLIPILAVISFIMYLPISWAINAFIYLINFKIDYFNFNYFNVDIYIFIEQLTIDSIIILIGIYLINQRKIHPLLRKKYLSGKINIFFALGGIFLLLFVFLFSPSNIYINSYFIIAFYNVITGIFNIFLSYILFKINLIEKTKELIVEYERNLGRKDLPKIIDKIGLIFIIIAYLLIYVGDFLDTFSLGILCVLIGFVCFWSSFFLMIIAGALDNIRKREIGIFKCSEWSYFLIPQIIFFIIYLWAFHYHFIGLIYFIGVLIFNLIRYIYQYSMIKEIITQK